MKKASSPSHNQKVQLACACKFLQVDVNAIT